MPEGKLTLIVLDVYGAPITEHVDIFMSNQTLSDTPVFRDVDVTGPRTLPNLNIFPNGRYRLEIDALSYHTVSRFISIPPAGSAEVTITLPVNPKKVLRVEFPPYRSNTVPDAAWNLLQNSPHVMNFQNKQGGDLYAAFDPIRKAGFFNLVAKASRTRIGGETVLSSIGELTELRGDRFFAAVPAALRSAVINSIHDGLFHEVSDLLHTPPPGFAPARSFKTMDHYGNLQLSFFCGPEGKFAVDMDIDDAQGFDHIFQVVGNFFGGPTHPYNIHEILIATQELDPGYRLILREAARMTA